MLDGSVTVLCAKGGVEPQSETVWRQADHYHVPRMIYVNKMDIMGADFFNVLRMVHDRLKCNAVPIQLPIGKEGDFRGIIDLVEMNADVYYDELGKDMRVEEIPEDMKDLANEYRDKLLEAVSEYDDSLNGIIGQIDDADSILQDISRSLADAGDDLVFDDIPWREALKAVGLRLLIMAVLGAAVLGLFHLLWPQAQWDRAVWLMFLLPPPYVLPVFSTDEKQRVYLSSVLSLSTLVTLMGFVLLAAIG